MRKHKYKAKPKITGGRYYGSTLERDLGDILSLLMQAGELKSIIHQPPAVRFPCGVTWRIDYQVVDKYDNEYYIEAKGMITSDYRKQLKCYKYHCPAPLFVIGKKNGQWSVLEEIDTHDVVNPIKER